MRKTQSKASDVYVICLTMKHKACYNCVTFHRFQMRERRRQHAKNDRIFTRFFTGRFKPAGKVVIVFCTGSFIALMDGKEEIKWNSL